jgi:hypothetical protein
MTVVISTSVYAAGMEAYKKEMEDWTVLNCVRKDGQLIAFVIKLPEADPNTNGMIHFEAMLPENAEEDIRRRAVHAAVRAAIEENERLSELVVAATEPVLEPVEPAARQNVAVPEPYEGVVKTPSAKRALK